MCVAQLEGEARQSCMCVYVVTCVLACASEDGWGDSRTIRGLGTSGWHTPHHDAMHRRFDTDSAKDERKAKL